jgi:hypothetical protein
MCIAAVDGILTEIAIVTTKETVTGLIATDLTASATEIVTVIVTVVGDVGSSLV